MNADQGSNGLTRPRSVYVLPPIALLFALQRYVAASLTMVSSGAYRDSRQTVDCDRVASAPASRILSIGVHRAGISRAVSELASKFGQYLMRKSTLLAGLRAVKLSKIASWGFSGQRPAHDWAVIHELDWVRPEKRCFAGATGAFH